MRRSSLKLGHLFALGFCVLLFCLSGLGWSLVDSFATRWRVQISKELESQAHLLIPQLVDRFSPSNSKDLQALCKRAHEDFSTRITLVDLSGKVLADSNEDPSRMNNHANRPEIKAAFSGKKGFDERLSHTLGENYFYVALPLRNSGSVIGAVRASVPANAFESKINSFQKEVALWLSVLAVICFGAGYFLLKRLTGALGAAAVGVKRYSKGHFDEAIPVMDSLETGDLARLLNQMAFRLQSRLTKLESRLKEQETVFSSMVEGVVAVDSEEQILRMNNAAAKLFQADSAQAQGRLIHEVVRNVDLLKFVSQVVSGQVPVEEDITLQTDEGEKYLQAHGTALRDTNGKSNGALIVLNDVTRIRRLETLRKEFVANVSHELKTPITSIKGWVETLLGGALRDPDEAKRFLEIVSRQADRLNAIIEDLLSLSRIEQEAEKQDIHLDLQNVRDVLQVAITDCKTKWSQKNLRMSIDCSPEIKAQINKPLMEQALVNLIDNAIKYSSPGESIEVRGTESNDAVVLSVKDYGCGIPDEHFPRLFERFYRVDKARSRQLGGTGLGLSIVKHIAQAHHGRVSVHSRLKEGSCFSIHLPKP